MKNATGNNGHEETIKRVQRIFEEKGHKALEMAKKAVLEEKIECKEVREALHYFMTEYWHDMARPALLSLVCEAVGGNPDITTPIAIPMTLISGAIDIHDDIVDQSRIKGSRPTVLGKFGKNIALLVGDALLFKGFTLLYGACEKIPIEKRTAVMKIIKNMFFELGDAEALELQFRGRIDVTPEEHLNVVRKKAADVEAHTRISAIIGNGEKSEIEALGDYGRFLGMLIILRDDLLDLVDFSEFVHRIKEEFLPLPMLYALQNPRIKPKINKILLKKDVTKKDNKTILELIQRSGAFKRTEKLLMEIFSDTSLSLNILKETQKNLQLIPQSVAFPFREKYFKATMRAI